MYHKIKNEVKKINVKNGQIDHLKPEKIDYIAPDKIDHLLPEQTNKP